MKRINKLGVMALSVVMAATLAISAILAQAPNGQSGSQEARDGKGRFGRHRGHHGRGMRGAIFRELNLTDEQKAQMKQIRQSYRERAQPLRQELRAKTQGLRQANQGGAFNEALVTQTLTETAPLRAKLMGESFKLRQEMMALLTPEQKAKIEQMSEQFKARRAERKAKRAQRQSQSQ
jgi:periplasmic protein CpxP/Spy